MALLEWSDEYSVGIIEFDAQHKNMFELINRFYGMMKETEDRQDLAIILKELVDYGSSHLANEERRFDEYDYPEKAGHRKAHNDYRKKIDDFMGKKEDSFLSFEIIDYLEDWWMGHITGVDKQYTEFFHGKGLK